MSLQAFSRPDIAAYVGRIVTVTWVTGHRSLEYILAFDGTLVTTKSYLPGLNRWVRASAKLAERMAHVEPPEVH